MRGTRKKLAALAREVAQHNADTRGKQVDSNSAWAAAFAGLGVQEDDRVCYLWPDNVAAWNAWQGVQTQWRAGMAGATGLDYAGVRAALDESGLSGDERRDIWRGIQAAERATLEVWAEQRERERE